MRSYEMTYLVASDISEEELKSFSEKINGFITQDLGVLEQEGKPARQRLGYSIKGKNEAFVVTVDFKLSPENLEKLEKKMQAEGKILRYMIATKQPMEKTLARKPKRVPKSLLMKVGENPKKETLKTDKKPGLQKVELKEIDKKIEEILNE